MNLPVVKLKMYLIVNSDNENVHEIILSNEGQYKVSNGVFALNYLQRKLSCIDISSEKIVATCPISVLKDHITKYQKMENEINSVGDIFMVLGVSLIIVGVLGLLSITIISLVFMYI